MLTVIGTGLACLLIVLKMIADSQNKTDKKQNEDSKAIDNANTANDLFHLFDRMRHK